MRPPSTPRKNLWLSGDGWQEQVALGTSIDVPEERELIALIDLPTPERHPPTPNHPTLKAHPREVEREKEKGKMVRCFYLQM